MTRNARPGILPNTVSALIQRLDVHLVGTSNPENLGAVARLLENFGLPSLSLVAPRVAPDHPRALVVGRAALERLAGARVHGSLDEAVAEASYVVGFSARRGARRPTVELRRLAHRIAERAPAGRVALVFGPEDTGLLAAHLERCDLHCAIDAPGPIASFNVAQAVALALWELARPVAVEDPAPPPGDAGDAAAAAAAIDAAAIALANRRGGATRADLEVLLDHAIAALDAIGYLGPHDAPGERERKRVHLRRVLAAAALTPEELRGLHGLCAQTLKALRPT